MSRLEGEAPVPLSVVVPTIGRPELLGRCLESLASCRPRAEEVVVVDQGAGAAAAVVGRHGAAGAVHVPCAGRGISLAVNTGLRAARHAVVAITHDDCTVEPSWAATALRLVREHPEDIVTGRVRPVGDPRAVPATRDADEPVVHSDAHDIWSLLPNNMAARREDLLAIGGFDERFDTAAEDLDLAHRWLRAGRAIRYEPDLVADHHDWRTAREMRRTYVRYARGCGLFYAKYLREPRDRRFVLGLLRRDLRDLRRGLADALRSPTSVWWDDRLGALPGLALGLGRGAILFRHG